MAEKKRSVGLVVLLEDVPGKTKHVAILQRRGDIDPEKLEKGEIRESFPGGCQVTVHGRLNDDETGDEGFLRALERETREELGFRATNMIIDFDTGAGETPFTRLTQVETETELVVTFGYVLPASFLKVIRLGPQSGGLVLLEPSNLDKVHDLRTFSKEHGVSSRDIVAMFPDELKVVRIAFEKLVSVSSTREAETTIMKTCDTCHGPLAAGGFCPTCQTGGTAEGAVFVPKT